MEWFDCTLWYVIFSLSVNWIEILHFDKYNEHSKFYTYDIRNCIAIVSKIILHLIFVKKEWIIWNSFNKCFHFETTWGKISWEITNFIISQFIVASIQHISCSLQRIIETAWYKSSNVWSIFHYIYFKLQWKF